MALFFAAQSLQNYKSLPFNNEVQSALRKFFHYLSSDLKHKIERMQQRLIFWVPPHELDVRYLKELLEAALEQRIVQIRYEASSVQDRLIQPLGLYTMNGLWYCRAYCFRAMDHRVFRVDRVSGLQCEVDQSQKVDLNEENIQEWIIREDLETPLELKVSLSPEGVRRCQSDVWLSQFLKVNEDGSGTIHAHIGTSYTPWVVGFFLGLGTDAHVTHPPQVRDQIRTKLQAMAAQYGD
nr:WYL domain-containing protein [Paenibacillus xylanexedens]